MVNPSRSWRWSAGEAQGESSPPWLHETCVDGAATWFTRMAVPDKTRYPPIVMVHGVVVSGAYFQPVAECLRGDFALYVPDVPGTGRSHSRHSQWSLEEQAEGLARWLDTHGLRHAVLVSNSIGCQVLTLLAASRPDLACALVLVGPTMDPEIGSALRVMARGVVDMPRERVGLWKVWIPDLMRTGPLEALRTLQMAINDPQVERLDRIQTPVLVVGGEHDPIVPRAWVEAMAARLPRGRAVIVPNSPHALNYSSPRRLAWIIRAAAGAWGDAAPGRR